MANWSIKKTEEREKRLRRLKDATGENTRSGAIDVACKHYLADLEAKRRHAEAFDAELAEKLSTPFVPIEKTVETSVGKTDE